MDYVKRAFLYLRRRIGKTLLLVLVMTAILTFMLAGLIIQNAALTAVNNSKNAVGTTVTLSANRAKLFQQNQGSASSSTQTPPTGGFRMNEAIIGLNTAKKIASLENVAAYQITASASVNASSFTAVLSSNSNSNGGFGRMQGTDSGDISVSGLSSTAANSNFKNKNYVMKKGRGITSSDANTNNVIIEKVLASNNHINVGDTIKVKDSSSNVKSLKVVGIYQAKTSTDQTFGQTQDPSNTIFSSYTLASSLAGDAGKVSNVVYTLTDSSKEKAFVKSAKKIISGNLQLTTSDQIYEMLTSSVKSIESIASKIVWIVGIAGIAILTLILILMVRERRHEIGILMSLGEEKAKIIGQIFVETISVLVISLCFAGVFGSFFGNSIGQQLISQQNTSQQSLRSGFGGPGGGNSNQAGPNSNTAGSGSPSNSRALGGQMRQFGTAVTGNSQLNKLSTHVSIGTLLELGAFGLVIVAIATLLGAIPIISLKPKRILISE
ncbi:ABC transporter permease [Oenococcus sp.]|uniref:ABC transporter permease n=1 Tax=Oenococcus sp. TaxID=1979414 RepID=UPI0039EA8BD7